MESQVHNPRAVGPAAALQRHKFTTAGGTARPLFPSENERRVGHQQLAFESHLVAIREQLERCLKGIAGNEESLNALREHAICRIARVDSLGFEDKLDLPASAQPEGGASRRSPVDPVWVPLSASINAMLPKHTEEAESSGEDDINDTLREGQRLVHVLRERRLKSGNMSRSTVDLSRSRSKNLTSLSDSVVYDKVDKRRQRSNCVVDLWTLLDEPDSSRKAAWLNGMFGFLTIVSIVLALLDSGRESILGFESIIIQLFCDSLLSLELLLRFYCCPTPKVFLCQVFTWNDTAGSLCILVVRSIFFQSKIEDNTWPYVILITLLPVLRLLMMLRRFEQIHLQFSAFRSAAEALPVLIYTLSTLVVFFGAIVYMVEPRANISSFADALWMTIVTCFTVGYGDRYPVTPAGRCVVSSLMFISALYMAIPIGIVGDAFSRVWAERDARLLVRRMSRRLRFAGIDADSIPDLFHRFDQDENGMINRAEFLGIIKAMHVNLDNLQALQLFRIIDDDDSGEITDEEFVKVLYPHSFEDMYDDFSLVVESLSEKARRATSLIQSRSSLG